MVQVVGRALSEGEVEGSRVGTEGRRSVLAVETDEGSRAGIEGMLVGQVETVGLAEVLAGIEGTLLEGQVAVAAGLC